MKAYRSCPLVSLCADYGGACCQSVCGLWQVYIFKVVGGGGVMSGCS